MEEREAERLRQEAEARKRRKPGQRGGPVRRIREGQIEAAADEWDQIIASAQADEGGQLVDLGE